VFAVRAETRDALESWWWSFSRPGPSAATVHVLRPESQHTSHANQPASRQDRHVRPAFLRSRHRCELRLTFFFPRRLAPFDKTRALLLGADCRPRTQTTLLPPRAAAMAALPCTTYELARVGFTPAPATRARGRGVGPAGCVRAPRRSIHYIRSSRDVIYTFFNKP
jgi:hypothetical protein